MTRFRRDALFALLLLFAINALNFFDRQLWAAVSEPVRRLWNLSDLQIGWLGTAFILLYAVIGVPLGRLADSSRRTHLLAFGVAFWSLLTSLSSLSQGFWSFFLLRLGIGVGEATCAPACTSLIGDLFEPHQRSRALSVYMLGLPFGLALSYLVGGVAAQHYGWRWAFLAAGLPGLFLAAIVALMPEPQRGRAEPQPALGAVRRSGSPYCIILRTPTMWWIIISGALHNFSLYAVSYFLPALLIRYHATTVQTAGFVSAIVIGIIGGAGMLLGGWAGDRLALRRPHGRLLLTALALLASAPAAYCALSQPPGHLLRFIVPLGFAWMLMYSYYPNVYSTIQDVLEPTLRGTGMALYFLAMYGMGAFLGPVAAGWMSDLLASRSAARAGVVLVKGVPIPEQFKALGLHQAMYMVPVLGVALAAVVFAGSLTVRRDIRRLEDWRRRGAE